VEGSHFAWASLVSALCFLSSVNSRGLGSPVRWLSIRGALCIATLLLGSWAGARLQKRHFVKAESVSS
jgi:hypothetical protein